MVVTTELGGNAPQVSRTDRDDFYWNGVKLTAEITGPQRESSTTVIVYTYHLTLKKGVNILRGKIDATDDSSTGWVNSVKATIENTNKAATATKLKEDYAFASNGTDANGVFTLTAGDNWMKNFQNLPLTGTDEENHVIYYGYSVKEVKVGETEVANNRAGEWIVSNGGDGYTSGTITVTNQKTPDTPDAPGYELPATGSTGTAPYTTAGAVLMGAALVGGYRRKRRQERRGE